MKGNCLKNLRLNSLILLWVFMAPVFFLLSCGKKAPPMPPREKPPAAIKDLSAQVQEDQLVLSWTVPSLKRTGGFYVYRSKLPISEPECKKCPVLFTRVADISITGLPAEEKAFTYNETLRKGYRYIYKVTVYSEAGLVSSDSNYVKFVY
ncbi:MAG: hypothetical protein JRH18_07695 [Deltaproteobacteria bacterium]|nr:hypothetical protein [Deltaproteobacteria bacterium]MBW2151533.1 hypothetical protein [Deltaproteobacteria bacterium]